MGPWGMRKPFEVCDFIRGLSGRMSRASVAISWVGMERKPWMGSSGDSLGAQGAIFVSGARGPFGELSMRQSSCRLGAVKLVKPAQVFAKNRAQAKRVYRFGRRTNLSARRNARSACGEGELGGGGKRSHALKLGAFLLQARARAPRSAATARKGRRTARKQERARQRRQKAQPSRLCDDSRATR